MKLIYIDASTSNFRSLLAEKAYISEAMCHSIGRRGITPVIPRRRNEKRRDLFNGGLYRERNLVEQLSDRLKQFRRAATRYEKRTNNYLVVLAIAAITCWL